VLDPASSHGVLRALMSGIAAADAARALLQDHSPLALARYAEWLGDWLDHDMSRLRSLYARRWPRAIVSSSGRPDATATV
jgi:hypothetical protein